jgi:CheY-like chemotaxis protein
VARILVVDDEPDIRLFLQVNLELDRHDVVLAADGAGALAAIDQQLPDLVLLDVMMPEVDGWAVLERLKSSGEREVKEIPVLMLTALADDTDQARGGIEGAVRYLTKPVTPDDLRTAVDEALHGDPEPIQRRRAQHVALERLARIEKGDPAETSQPRPRLSRLEPVPVPPPSRAPREIDPTLVAGLTSRQRELLAAVKAAPSVTAAAAGLGMSRSNVYATLRRVGRRLGVPDVTDLLELLRDGGLRVDTES